MTYHVCLISENWQNTIENIILNRAQYLITRVYKVLPVLRSQVAQGRCKYLFPWGLRMRLWIKPRNKTSASSTSGLNSLTHHVSWNSCVTLFITCIHNMLFKKYSINIQWMEHIYTCFSEFNPEIQLNLVLLLEWIHLLTLYLRIHVQFSLLF